MSRHLGIAAAIALVALIGVSRPAAAESDVWEAKNVSKILTDAQRALAAEMNQELKPQPRILLSERSHVYEIQRRRMKTVISRYSPEKAKDEAFIRAQAAAAAQSLFGFYDAPTHTVHLVPENFEAISGYIGQPGMLSNEFVLSVLVHEMVHVYDQQNHQIWAKLTRTSKEESQIWGVIAEGHAQYVTERVMSRLQLNKQFYAYTKASFSIPPTTDEVSRHQAEVRARQSHFRYVMGHRFFQQLKDYGGPEYVDEAFTRPPKTISEILHPERYIHGTPANWPATVNTEPLLREVMSGLNPGWRQTKIPYTEGNVYARFGDLIDEKEVLGVGEHFVSAHALVAEPKKRSSSYALCAIEQMDSPVGAAKLVKAFQGLREAEKTNFEGAGGKYTFHQMGELIENSRVPHFRETRIREYKGALSSQAFVTFAVKNFVVECEFNESPRSDPELVELISDYGKKIVAVSKQATATKQP